MITIRHFTAEDAAALREHYCRASSLEETEEMIRAWNAGQFNGRYFEMFAVVHDGIVVGCISLYGKSASIVSIGPEIFADYRNRGFGRAAMEYCLQFAKAKGYTLVVQQIREDNGASIALHESLGFETDGYVFRNRRDNPVLIYIKALREDGSESATHFNA